MYEGVLCSLINLLINIIKFISKNLNLDLLKYIVIVIGFMNILYGMVVLVLDGVFDEYFFEYDKLFFLDFIGKNFFVVELLKKCKENNVIIKVEIGEMVFNFGRGMVVYVRYVN